MLFFKDLSIETKDEIIDRVADAIYDVDTEYISEILDSLLEDEGIEYAIDYSYDCLLIRAFDGKYFFPYPVALTEFSNPAHAAWELREYSVKQEIPLIYTDVPRDELGALVSMYRHANIDASDPCAESYTVRIMSEAALMPEIPEISLADVTLSPLTPDDDELYAELCKDDEINKYWGFDYREDVTDPEDSYFREAAEGEFNRGISMTFAVRYNGTFVGDALLYGFDHMGCCQCAVRLFKKYMQRGIATQVLCRFKTLCFEMGLVRLCATVYEENVASEKLCKKIFDSYEYNGEKVIFTADL